MMGLSLDASFDEEEDEEEEDVDDADEDDEDVDEGGEADSIGFSPVKELVSLSVMLKRRIRRI